ncbi:MAG: hypothetical protein PVSMB8_12460 [Vulcanimicrobiaceae bacterium]
MHERRIGPPLGLKKLDEVLTRHKGTRPVILKIKLADGGEATLRLDRKVSGSPALLEALREFQAA